MIVKIEKVVHGAKGLSRDLQKVTFVPFTLPGEKVEIKIHKEHRDYIEADATGIVEPSADRVAPECRYYGQCGGCQLSHAHYEAQVRIKETVLRETLLRNHVAVPPINVFTSKPWGYRHRVRFQYDIKQKRLGFYRRETNQVVDVAECLCLTPALNGLLQALRTALQDSTGVREIDCYENESGETAISFRGRLSDASLNYLSGKTRILEPGRLDFTIRFKDFQYPMHPDVFIQVNPHLWKVMTQEVQSHYLDAEKRIAVELYAGAGFFTLPLARIFSKIFACEENIQAIDYVRSQAQVGNIEWRCCRAEDFKIPTEASVAVIDPPRTGLHPAVTGSLLTHSFERISYISCDPTSFARDAARLGSKYRISRLSLIDLFPQTFHFETIALLEKTTEPDSR